MFNFFTSLLTKINCLRVGVNCLKSVSVMIYVADNAIKISTGTPENEKRKGKCLITNGE